MKRLSILGLTLIVGLLMAACAPGKEVLTPTPTVAEPSSKTVAKEPWEKDWGTLVKEAQKEGKVSFYTNWAPANRIALTQAFGRKFNIDLEFTPFSRSNDLIAKAEMENKAGLYFADIFSGGQSSLAVTMKPMGILGPIEPTLILPEVKDPKNWLGGRFPFVDDDRRGISMIAVRFGHIIYNTDVIRAGEITTYKDLLKPQYKGKITIDDPTVSGPINTLMTYLALDMWNLEEAKEFLRQLIQQQGAVIQRDQRLNVESVARGKYAIGLAPQPPTLAEFIKVGAPLGVINGPIITSANGNIAVSTKFGHPNAAKVFINWLLTKDGQTVFSQSFGSPSLRNDVSTEGIDPLFLTQPGERLYFYTEKHMLFSPKMAETSRIVIQDAAK